MKQWKEYKLGELLNFRRGHDLPKSEMIAGDIPVAGSNGVIGFHNEATPISPCITIGRSGNVGTANYYDKCWAHNTVLYIDDFKDNNPEFLFYLLKTIPLKTFGGGSAVPTLNRNHIHPIVVKSTKDIELQKKIVEILKSLDDKIELNRRINDNLEQQAQALFKSWFVDFEPFKDGEFVDSELGMIPKEWRVGKLCDIAEVTMGQSPSGDSYNENGIGEIFYQGRTEFGYRFPSIRLYTTAPNRMAEKNSILLSVRAPVGDINVSLQKCCIGRGLASINAIDNYYSFVFYTVKSMKKNFDVYNGEGTIFGSINKESLNNMSVIIPADDIKSNFENIVSKLDNEYRLNHNEIVNLSNLRDTLLPRLMSGELKINDLNC